METLSSVDLTGSFPGDLHGVLREAARRGPLAEDEATGGIVVLRQRDVEVLVHDQRLNGIGLALFNMMGVAAIAVLPVKPHIRSPYLIHWCPI